MPRKQLNLPLLFWTLTALVVGAAAIRLLHGWQVSRYARAAFAEAERAGEEGRLTEAAAAWHRCLGFAPEDPVVMLRYGLTLSRMSDSSRARARALSLLRQVVARDPGRDDVRRRLADLALESGHPDEAGRHLEALLPASADPAEVETLLGRCAEREGATDRAAQWYDRAMRHAPGRVEPAVLLAALWQRVGRPARAAAVMDALVKADPKSPAAYLARAWHYLGLADLDRAEADLDRAADRAPDDAGVLAARAELELRRGRLDAARAAWRKGIAAHPDDASFVLGLARLEARAGRDDEAADCLRRALERRPEQPELLAALAELLLRLGELEEGGALLARLRKTAAPAAHIKYLEGCELEQRGRCVEAARLLAEVAAVEPATERTVQALTALASCQERLGAADRQLAVLERAVELGPSSPEARRALGSVYLALGRVDEAAEQFRQLLKLPQAPPEAATLLARALLHRAVQAPSRAAAWPDFERAVALAESAPGQGVAAELLRAEGFFAAGEAGLALAALTDLRRRHPDEVAVWTTSVELTGYAGDLNAARDLLRQAHQRLGDRIELRLAACGAWLPEKAGRKTEQMLAELEKGLDHFSPADQGRLLRRLAEARARLGEPDYAVRLARRLAEAQPDDVRNQFLLLRVSLAAGFGEGVESALAALHRLEGEEGTSWRYGQAAWLAGRARRADDARLREARELLGEVHDSRPNWPLPLLLEGQLEEREGRIESALTAYGRAIELGERPPALVVRVGRMLAERGRHTEADRVFRLLPPEARPGAALLRAAAESALAARHPDRAVELARRAVGPGTGEVRDHLWLGNLLAVAGRNTEAEEEFRSTVRAAPDAPESWLALVAHLARTGRPEQIDPVPGEIRRRLSPDQAALTLARCYEAMARFDRAAAEYREALRRRPGDAAVLRYAAAFEMRLGRVGAAEPLFRALLGSNPPDDVAAWARRGLALCLAERGEEAALTEAVALLEKNAPDPRARALVTAARPGKRRAALAELERLPAAPLPPPEDRYRLARLYEADGQWARAEPLYKGLLAQDADNPAYLSGLIETLLRRKKIGEAETALARLERVEPDSPRTRDLRSRARVASTPARPRQ